MAYAIARMGKQKGGSVGSSSLHNGRWRNTPNADPSREQDNRVLFGDEKAVPERVREIIQEHGGKPRSDSVEAVEIILSASPEWWRDDHDEIDLKKVDQFSAAAKEFLLKKETGGILVRATLHMDEHSPHIHAIKVPIDDKGVLNCKHYFGDREKLSRWQDSFADQVKGLDLERGVRDSRARHTDIKDFYKAIERDPQIRINHKKLPDPPRVFMSKDAIEKYKEELAKAVVEQAQRPIKTQLHQAMLARDVQGQLKETKRRLAKTSEQLAKEQLKGMDLTQENQNFRQHTIDLAERTQKAEARFQDVDRNSVMKLMGWRGFPADKRGSFTYLDPQQTRQLTVRGGGSVFDQNGQLLARNSVELVRELLRHAGKPHGREDAVGWLADKCGQERATAASMVEHEQAIGDYLHERKVERDRTIKTPVRDQTLVRPEPERVRDRGMDRDGPEHDFVPSR